MPDNFRNLLHVVRRYKVATIANILGLSLAFAAFIAVMLHVRYEYGYDSTIPEREYIFQAENLRGDGVWESNWARPQIERFIAHSPHIVSAAIYNGNAYSSFEFGFSKSEVPGSPVIMKPIERVRPGFLETFDFDFVAGSAASLAEYGSVLIPQSLAKQLFGDEDPIGKTVYPSEFRDIPTMRNAEGKEVLYMSGIELEFGNGIGGVYRDFPENNRLQNVIYILIPESEQMEDWYTGSYYCYVKLSSPEIADEISQQYMAENREDLIRHFDIHDIKLKPLDGLYFMSPVRADAGPYGNKPATDMLLLIGILIIVIALINYVNFSVALAPVRIKSINTRKVLGCSQGTLRANLITESLAITVFAFLVALGLVILLQNGGLLTAVTGHRMELEDNWIIIVLTAIIAIAAGVLSGIYPAFYMTSFPPAMAINGSFALTGRARATRRILIGFQYVISIVLIIGAVFIALQNRYIRMSELGFEKDKVVEVRLGMGTALTKNKLFGQIVLQHTDIEDISFSHTRFVTDENQSLIGYFYRSEHYYMAWRGVTPNFLDVMGIELLAGRNFRPSDEERDDDRAVVIINETAAREIIAPFEGEINDITQLVGTHIRDNGENVEIIGISRDFHHQSLYRHITPYGFWVSAEGRYRRTWPECYSYIKIGPGDPSAALAHIRNAINEIDPGYPADIRFMDEAMERLYVKSHKQGLMVTVFSMLAIIISLVGVFGLVIFEAQRREKEIAVRKVFGAGIGQILSMFNSGFLKIVGMCFVIAVPLAVWGVNKWLQNFSYKTPLHLWVFLVALASITVLTAVTVTFQSYRTASENPARKLHR